MISYLILHYNRPYLLDINVKLLRKFSKVPLQIIVADDGSSQEVIRSIKKLPIDNLYSHAGHFRVKGRGSCSYAIRESLRLCKNEYFVFSEDDFLFNPKIGECIYGKGDTFNGDIFPRLHFDKEVSSDFFGEAIKALNTSGIKQVQLCRNVKQEQLGGSFETGDFSWRYVDFSKTKSYYTSNWPNLMRRSDQCLDIVPSGLDIAGVEDRNCKLMISRHGKSNWACCPASPVFQHVGLGVSLQPNRSEGRLNTFRSMQQGLFGKVKMDSVDEFNNFLTRQYVNEKLSINIDEIIEGGLNEYFVERFK